MSVFIILLQTKPLSKMKIKRLILIMDCGAWRRIHLERVLGLSRWGVDFKQGSLRMLVEVGKDYDSCWCSQSRTGPERERKREPGAAALS